MPAHMRKSAVLSNGSLAVGLNEQGLVSDFYYPYVGQQNLTNSRRRPHYIGVWVDGVFSWTHEDKSWFIEVRNSEDALQAHCTYRHDGLGVELTTTDFVDPKYDIFRRQVNVTNVSDQDKEVRLFFYQTFRLSQDGRTDTVLYVPDDHYIYDYKGRVCLLIAGEVADQGPFDQWAVGNTDIEGKEGTFRDAEDGELSKGLVEHSSVDSTIRFSCNVSSKETKEVRYWVCAGDSQYDVERNHAVARTSWNSRDNAHQQHWRDWHEISNTKLDTLSEKEKTVVKKSLQVIKAHIDSHGGVVASLDSSIFNYGRDYYSYVWPRDGVYVMRPLLHLGHHKEVLSFLEFCSRVLKPGGYLQHKYQPDGSVGSTWHPLDHHGGKRLAIQEDETASVLQLAVEYYFLTDKNEFLERHFDTFIVPMAEFLLSYVHPVTDLPYPSYDLWEEKLETTTYTTAMVIKALNDFKKLLTTREATSDNVSLLTKIDNSLSRIEKSLHNLKTDSGYYSKGVKSGNKLDSTVDISTLYGLILGDISDTEGVRKTFEEITNKLIASNGGIIRYEHDNYFTRNGNPNPWFVATLWLAQCAGTHAINDNDLADRLLQYCLDYIDITNTEMLPEQILPDDSKEKIGVTPLIWSHAELIQTILQLKTAR